jgi:hypothetical protein
VLCIDALGQSDTPAIDHVRVLVRDIAAAQNTLHALGFEMDRPEPSVYQEGSAHTSAPLSDGTYLELIGIADREKLLKSEPEDDFAKRMCRFGVCGPASQNSP